jgi:hypothetical protein
MQDAEGFILLRAQLVYIRHADALHFAHDRLTRGARPGVAACLGYRVVRLGGSSHLDGPRGALPRGGIARNNRV